MVQVWGDEDLVSLPKYSYDPRMLDLLLRRASQNP